MLVADRTHVRHPQRRSTWRMAGMTLDRNERGLT